MPPSLELSNIFNYIDENKSKYISSLREAVSIPSVSASAEHREDCNRMVDWTAARLKALGAAVDLREIGDHKIGDVTCRLPPVIVASLGNFQDKNKPCVCIYGHLDVQPAQASDGWNTEPFELVELKGKLFGRGSTDDKGPVLGWIHAIEAFNALQQELPVNIKFIFESMEESGSLGLGELLMDKLKPEGFFDNVDYVCISDNYWLGTEKPSITYGLRGICCYSVEVQCASMDLHSGIYGGSVHEAMPDLLYLLDQLVDRNGKILITDVNRDVVEESEQELGLYEDISFNVDHFRNSVGANALMHKEDKVRILMNRWRFPSLSIHGIEGAFHGPGFKTVIPGKVTGKFSIRIVPNQDPEHINKCVIEYLERKWRERGTPNKLKVLPQHGGDWWTEDPFHKHYQAAAAAVRTVYKVDPDMVREGGSIPVTLTIQKASGCNMLLLPMGSCDDMAHSQNEKLNVSNYIEGTKLMAAYLHEVGQLK